MRKKITETYFRHFKSLYEPNSTTLTQVFHTIISSVFLWYSMSSQYEQQRCDKLQHNPLVLSFRLWKIRGSMKEILSPLPATGLSYQHFRKKNHLVAERPAEYSASRRFSQISGWYADFAPSRPEQITSTSQSYIPYLCGNTCPSKTNHSSAGLIKTKLLIYSYCILIQLLLLFEFRDTIAFVYLVGTHFHSSLSYCCPGEGGLLLFCYSGKTHHNYINRFCYWKHFSNV